MRKIFRDETKTNQLYSEGREFATHNEVAQVVNELNQTKEQLVLVAASLENYKEQNQEGINTAAINAINAAISTLESTVADLENAEIDSLTVSGLSTLSSLVAQIGTFTTQLTSPKGTINDFKAVDIEVVGGVTANAIIAASANIQDWTTENLNVTDMQVTNKIQSAEMEAQNITGSEVEADSLKVNNDALFNQDVQVIGKVTSESTESDEIDTSNIVWKDTQTITNTDDFYITIPHFENGVYCISLSNNGAVRLTVEIFNSIDNYFVRWSQPERGFLTYVFKNGENEASQIGLQIHNINNEELTLKYGVISKDAGIPGPSTYAQNPFTDPNIYLVTYKDGSKFFKNVDLANQGSTVGTLSKRSTNLYDLKTESYDYDTTENVTNVDYVPDQSVNTTDDVKFRSVDSSFVNVAELEVTNKLKTKNIYNGPALSSAEIDELPDESLLLGNSVTSGTIDVGVTINDGDVAESLIDAYNHVFYINTDYKPQDGYDLGNGTHSNSFIERIGLEDLGYTASNSQYLRISLVVDTLTQVPYTFHTGVSNGKTVAWLRRLEDYEVSDLGAWTLPSKTKFAVDDTTTFYYRDAAFTTKIARDWAYQAAPGDKFYYSDGTEYQIIIPQFGIYKAGGSTVEQISVVDTITNIPYTRAGVATKISRKTTIDSNTQVLPFIPYEEVSTLDDPVADTNPLVYDTDTDSIKKVTGDVTLPAKLNVADDVTLGADIDVTGDATIGGDTSITGDTTITGALQVGGNTAITGTTTIHGDLYVDGTTHTTSEEQVSTTADVMVLRQNNSTTLGATYSGIIINKYNGSSDLALVTDSDGTLRVGTGVGTTTLYNDIYWDDDTSKWYSDAELTTEVTPTGNLTSWGSVETLGDVKHYTDAVFTVASFSDLVPLLGRDEDTNLNDQGLMKWDADDYIAKTIDMPTTDGQVLINKVSPASSTTVYYEDAYPTAFYNDDFTSYSGTPSGTAGTPSSVGLFYTINDDWYKKNGTGDYLLVTSFTDTGTAVTDPTLIQQLDETTFFEFYEVTYTVAASRDYEWGIIPHNYVFATMADYQAVASSIPNGSMVIIQDETNYLIGDNQ